MKLEYYRNGTPITGPRREKTCLRGFADTKGADQPTHLHQPVHPCRLISVFDIRLLVSIISKVVSRKTSIC